MPGPFAKIGQMKICAATIPLRGVAGATRNIRLKKMKYEKQEPVMENSGFRCRKSI
jgi:hypothetical protein